MTIFFFVCLFLVAQSCPTLCDPMDCSPPGFCIYGTLQARILELLFSSPGDFPDPGIEPESPAVTVFSLLIISQQHPCFYFSEPIHMHTHPHTQFLKQPSVPFQSGRAIKYSLHSHVIRTYKDLLAPKAPNPHRDKEILLWQQLLIFSLCIN